MAGMTTIFQRTGLVRYSPRVVLMIAFFFCYCLETTRTFEGGVVREVWKMQEDLLQEGES